MTIREAALLEPGTVVQFRGLDGTQPAIVREVLGMSSPRVVVRIRSGAERVAIAKELRVS